MFSLFYTLSMVETKLVLSFHTLLSQLFESMDSGLLNVYATKEKKERTEPLFSLSTNDFIVKHVSQLTSLLSDKPSSTSFVCCHVFFVFFFSENLIDPINKGGWVAACEPAPQRSCSPCDFVIQLSQCNTTPGF